MRFFTTRNWLIQLLLITACPIFGQTTSPAAAARRSLKGPQPSRSRSAAPASAANNAAVLKIETGIPVEDLVRKELIGGSCFEVRDIQFKGLNSGGNRQIGRFSNGAASIGFNQGIIFSTGRVTDAPGPNDDFGPGGSRFGLRTPDPDFLQIYKGIPIDTLQDLAVLSFRFTPTKSIVSFEYVFASEEYCEFVGTQYKDAFGFFVSGPGINGTFSNNSINVATVPGSRLPVNIDNISHLQNKLYFVNNARHNDAACSDVTPSPAREELQFDGYTTGLRAVFEVVPCQEYYIEMKVIDAGDSWYDSAVFLKAGSFDAGGDAAADFVVNGIKGGPIDTTFEGCGVVNLVFDRLDFADPGPYEVEFEVEGTATPGVDYLPLPTRVLIPDGQDRFTLPVTILKDALRENPESIIVRLREPCSCTRKEETLIILDLEPMTATAVAKSPTLCGPGNALVDATPKGGSPPYRYRWSTGAPGDTTRAITPFITGPRTFTVTVTDVCGQTAVASATANLNAPPTGEFSATRLQICPGGTARLPIRLTGTKPFEIRYTLDGVEQAPVVGIDTNFYQLVINRPGQYKLTIITDRSGCQSPGKGEVLLIESTLEVSGLVVPPTCAGQRNGSIATTLKGGQEPYVFTWTGPGTNTAANLTNLAAGEYMLQVTDLFGCRDTETFRLVDPPAIVPRVVTLKGVSCAGLDAGSIDLDVSGGKAPYSYRWNTTAVVQDLQNLTAGSYTVTITDQNSCTTTATYAVIGDVKPPIVVAKARDKLTCANGFVSLDGSGSSVGNNLSYQWTANPGNILSGATTLSPSVNRAGTYTLVVIDNNNGCTAAAQAQVEANSVQPTVVGGPDQVLTCAVDQATLDATGSSTGDRFTYQWTAGPGGTVLGGGTTLKPIVRGASFFIVEVTNNENGCKQLDTVRVTEDFALPTAAVSAPDLLTCTEKNISIVGSGTTKSGQISYNWFTVDGNITFGRAMAEVFVNEPGTYTLVITDLKNGCTASRNVTVAANFTDPDAKLATSGELNCRVSQLTLDATGTSNGAGFTLTWKLPDGVTFAPGGTTLRPNVNQPGQYTLEVKNTATGCSTSASILVVRNTTPPPAKVGDPTPLNCLRSRVRLGDSILTPIPDLVYTWRAAGGSPIISGAGTPSIVVDRPDTYSLTVEDRRNGCSANSSVIIARDVAPPVVAIAPAPQLTCINPSLRLDARGSSSGAGFAYNWTSANGIISIGGNTLQPTIEASGIYNLLITNTVNGCTATRSVDIRSDIQLPVAAGVVGGVISCRDPEVRLSATGSSSGPNIVARWGTLNGKIVDRPSLTEVLVNAPGQYTLIIEDTLRKCLASTTVDVLADIARPLANAGPDQTLNCAETVKTLDGSASSQGAIFTYQWAAISGGRFASATDIVSPLASSAGTYRLVVTNSLNGCTASSTVQLLNDAANPVVRIDAPPPISCKAGTVTIDASRSSVGPGFTFAWRGPGIVSGGNTLMPVVNLDGEYTLRISNVNNGCFTDQNITVTADFLPPVANAGPDSILNCYNSELQLGNPTGSSGPNISYKWTGPGILAGADGPRPVVNAIGVYKVIVTNTRNGCTAVDSVQLTDDFARPTANAGQGTRLTCNQTTYTIRATGSEGPEYAYRWETSTGSFVSGANTLTPTINGAGFYFLTVTNNRSGCTWTASVQITQDRDIPKADAGTAGVLTCDIFSAQLDGSQSSAGSNFIYQWTASRGGNIVTGATTLMPTVDKPGLYRLMVIDTSNGCMALSSVGLDEDRVVPEVKAGPDRQLTCAQDTVRLRGFLNANGLIDLTWTALNGGTIVAGARTIAPSVSTGGTYVVVAKNLSNGCLSRDTIAVTADRVKPRLVIRPPSSINCRTSIVQLDASPSATAGLQWQWSSTNGRLRIEGDSLRPVVDSSGVYRLSIFNPVNSCVSTDSVIVREDRRPPVADAGIDGEITCAATSVVLDGSKSSQGSQFFKQWFSPNGDILSGANQANPVVVSPGVYMLTVLNLENGCTNEDKVEVGLNVKPPVIAIAPPGVITCNVFDVVLDGSRSQQGPAISYAWSTRNGNIIEGEKTAQAKANTPGLYILNLRDTANGCSNVDSVEVADNRVLPEIDAGPIYTLTCAIERVRLQAFAPTDPQYRYRWSTLDGLVVTGENSLIPVVAKSGLYLLTVFNTATGCLSRDSTRVFKETNLPFRIEVDTVPPTCKNNDGILNFMGVRGGIGPYFYSIDNGANYKAETEFSGLRPGRYALRIRDANGCLFNDSLTVPEAPRPRIFPVANPNLSIRFGDTLRLRATLDPKYPRALIDTVIWKPWQNIRVRSNSLDDLLTPDAWPYKSGYFTVIIKSVDECEDSARIAYRVTDTTDVYIPNVFNPDSEINNRFTIFTKRSQIDKIELLQINNRWGGMVFENRDFSPNDPREGWDGTLGGGRPLQPDVFVYIAWLRLVDGRRVMYAGDVTLIR